MKKLMLSAIFLCGLLTAACSGLPHTWGYAHTARPGATSAYIRAVMARENGDYALALAYYDAALRLKNSEKVRQERRETQILAESVQ